MHAHSAFEGITLHRIYAHDMQKGSSTAIHTNTIYTEVTVCARIYQLCGQTGPN